MANVQTTGNFKNREKLEREVVRLYKKNPATEVAKLTGISTKTAWAILHQKAEEGEVTIRKAGR